MELLKATFPVKQIKAEPPDARAQYEAKARESICGSMVFVERKKLVWDEPEV